MTVGILVIGGYGHFGAMIAQELALDANIQVIVAGRSLERAR